MTDHPPPLELIDLYKEFGDREAVAGLSLDFQPGTLCALLGRNGAGKTTTLRLIMGHLRPTAGEVRLFGRWISDPDIQEVWKRVGYLAAEPVLYEHLTGREFLQFLIELRGLPRSKVDAIDGYADAIGLGSHIDQPIRTTSTGTKRKVAFIAAVLHDPDVLLLDEPTSTLDAVSAREVRSIVRGFRDRGSLVLFTTHQMDEAERLADRVSILREGQLAFDGGLEELRKGHGRGSEPLEEIFIRLTEPGGGGG